MTTTPPLPPPPPASAGPHGGPPPPPPAARTTARSGRLPWVLTAVLAVVALVLGLLLVLQPFGGGGSDERGFDSPEEAIEFATDSLADGDGRAALSAWAIDVRAAEADLAATLERFGTLTPQMPTSLPADDGVFTDLASVGYASQAAGQYTRMAYALLLPDIDPTRATQIGEDTTSADEIADALDGERLASLEVVRVERIEGRDGYGDVLNQNAELMGADERREYLVLYRWDGDTYLGGAGVLRYGDDWHIDSLGAAYANIGLGELVPASESDLEERLTGAE